MAFITIVFEGYMACPPTMTTLSGAAQTLVEASTPEARARLIPKESAIVRFIHCLLLSVAIRPGGHGRPLFPLTDEQRGWMQRHGAFFASLVDRQPKPGACRALVRLVMRDKTKLLLYRKIAFGRE